MDLRLLKCFFTEAAAWDDQPKLEDGPGRTRVRVRMLRGALRSREIDRINCVANSASSSVSSNHSSLFGVKNSGERLGREVRGSRCFGVRRDAVKTMDVGPGDQFASLPVSFIQDNPLALAGRGQEMLEWSMRDR